MHKNCEGCCYCRNIYIYGHILACHYMLDTGEERGCDPANCNKKKVNKDLRAILAKIMK